MHFLPLAAETGERVAGTAAETTVTADARMPELVIALTLRLVLQDFSKPKSAN
jgi:hypothetical protein